MNFGKMKFVILPMLRENMHTVCDIPISFDQVLSEWSPKFPQGIDCSLINVDSPLDWFVQDLNIEAQQQIEQTNLPAQEGTLSVISDIFPARIESV